MGLITSETRICASFRLRMKFETLFMSDEEKHGHHFDLSLFFNISMQFLAPGGLSVFKLVSCNKPEASSSRELALRPTRPEKLKLCKLVLSYTNHVIVVNDYCVQLNY